jgi:hypothetical protein
VLNPFTSEEGAFRFLLYVGAFFVIVVVVVVIARAL